MVNTGLTGAETAPVMLVAVVKALCAVELTSGDDRRMRTIWPTTRAVGTVADTVAPVPWPIGRRHVIGGWVPALAVVWRGTCRAELSAVCEDNEEFATVAAPVHVGKTVSVDT